VGICRPDLGEAVGIRIGQGSKQNAIHCAEDDSVCADTKSQCENSNNGEPGVAAKLPQAAAQVLDERFNNVRAPDVTALLFHLVEPSELEPSLSARFFWSHARGLEIGDSLLDVESKLSVEMFLCEVSSEESLMPAHGFTLTPI
jgi:hypothetical protein